MTEHPLGQFLHARWDEREQRAANMEYAGGCHCGCDPDQIRAEVAAQRKILEGPSADRGV